jgi:glycerophosphoryl diester phosphodiesterase
VHLTADEKYILFHDSHALHRTTNAQGRIDELTFDEVRALDAGSWKGNHFAGL